MTADLTSLLLAGLIGIVVSTLGFFVILGRRTRAAFEDGRQRQGERDGAERQLLEERLDVRLRETIRLERVAERGDAVA